MVIQKQNGLLYILNVLWVFECAFTSQYVQKSRRCNNTKHTLKSDLSQYQKHMTNCQLSTTVAFALLILKKTFCFSDTTDTIMRFLFNKYTTFLLYMYQQFNSRSSLNKNVLIND